MGLDVGLLLQLPHHRLLRGLTGMRSAGLAALLLLLVTVDQAAAALHVQLTDRSPAQRCITAGGAIVATSDDAHSPAVRVATREGKRDYDVDLPSDRLWRIAAKTEGCWSATRDWTPALGPALPLELFAAGEVRGTFTVAGRDRPSRITGAMHAASEEAGAAESLECALDFPAWRCAVPADVPFDLRISPAGFAPILYWNVVVRAGQKNELEPQRLIAGASVNGWVRDAKGHPFSGATVTVAPLDATHEALRGGQTKSNERGFFQLAGIAPGEYRLVALADALSPAVVPVVKLRPDEALIMPRFLELMPLATLDVALDPPLAPDGKQWTLALYEQVPLVSGASAPATRRTATEDGRWTSKNLRADVYRLAVEDSSGAVFEERTIDLSKGSGAILPISIHALQVHGRLLVGDEPLQADIRFTDDGGKRIWVSTGVDGTFDAPFPAAGDWSPLVFPAGRTGPRISAKRVRVEAGDREPMLEIHLPGGRLRGTVVTASEKPAKAAVHVTADGRLVAQQLTGDEGKFDFVGLDVTTYGVSAEAMEGTTKMPAMVDLRDDPVAEVKLTVDPYRVLRGVVLTPAGQPSSGALVRLSLDRGLRWTDINADVEGRFEYSLSADSTDVMLIALTHSYPAAVARLRLGSGDPEPLTIALSGQGGRLQIRGKGYVIARDLVAPFPAFVLPYDAGERGAYLEPGSYAVCPQPGVTDDCRRILVATGSRVSVDMLTPERKEGR
jgi:hypothetical protein